MIADRFYKIFLAAVVAVCSIMVLIFYILNRVEIHESLSEIPGMWSITIFILIRINVTLGMAVYSFHLWLKQDKLHFLDIHFLFGLFFLGLVFGKSLNLLYKLIYFSADKDSLLLLLKIRYIFIFITAAPLILIGIDNYLLSKTLRYEKLTDDEYRKKIDLIIITLLLVIESLIVSLICNIIIVSLILIIIHISSLIIIIYTFYTAYKKKLFPQIKPLIIAAAFFLDLILYAITIMTTTLRRKRIGFSPVYTIFAELVDLIIIIIIFWGYYAKPNTISD